MKPERATEIEVVLERPAALGEGPRWDERGGRLWWTDIEGRRLHSCRADGSEHREVRLEPKVGALGLCASEGMVLATSAGFARWRDDGHNGGHDGGRDGALEPLGNPLEPGDEVRFNDGLVDPLGRFWAGSMNGLDNSLFRLEGSDKARIERVAGGFGLPNGMGFSPDGRTFYFTDSEARTIYAYDFDPATGELEQRRALVTSEDEPGVPDGLTVDAEGFLWSARWGGWKLSRYDPAGGLEREVALPVEQATSCAFGGEDLGTLFVTSARQGLSAAQLAEQPLAGCLLRLRPGVRGKPEYRFAD